MGRGSFDGGDQGLLNTFFSDWATKDIASHLPFIYNMVATATYSYLPAYKYFGKQVKIVHFIGATKPWLVSFDEAGNARIGRPEKHTHLYLKLWWQIFNNSVRPLLNRTVPSNSVSTTYKQNRITESQKSHEIMDCSFQGLVCLGTVTSADYMASPPSPGPAVTQQPADSKESWECGSPDYMGTASFDNILKKIEKTIQDKESEGK